MIKTKLNDKIEIVNAVLSSILMLLFCIETYYIGTEAKAPFLIAFYLPILFTLSMDWLLSLFIAQNRLQYLFSKQSFVSYVTLIPQSLIVFEVIENPEIIRKYELDALKVLRIFSLVRLTEVFKRNNKVLEHAIFQVIYSIAAMGLLFSCGFLVVENKLYINGTCKKMTEMVRENPSYQKSTHESECHMQED